MYRNLHSLPLVALTFVTLSFVACNQEKKESNDSNSKGADEKMFAVCEIVEVGGSGVSGTVNFEQQGETVTITGKIEGLTPGKHGFHVHASGDLSDKEKGESTGGHFDPTNMKHGRPSDEQRHVGDLGNITADDNGVATIDMTDTVISLSGDNSIVGKAIVVHAGEDKFTQPTGDAGARVAFGKIVEKE